MEGRKNLKVGFVYVMDCDKGTEVKKHIEMCCDKTRPYLAPTNVDRI